MNQDIKCSAINLTIGHHDPDLWILLKADDDGRAAILGTEDCPVESGDANDEIGPVVFANKADALRYRQETSYSKALRPYYARYGPVGVHAGEVSSLVRSMEIEGFRIVWMFIPGPSPFSAYRPVSLLEFRSIVESGDLKWPEYSSVVDEESDLDQTKHEVSS